MSQRKIPPPSRARYTRETDLSPEHRVTLARGIAAVEKAALRLQVLRHPERIASGLVQTALSNTRRAPRPIPLLRENARPIKH
jgi:hypothetical protein